MCLWPSYLCKSQKNLSLRSEDKTVVAEIRKAVMELEIISIQFSCSVMSNSLQPHRLQHFRPTCPSPTPGVYPNSCPLSQWCHLTISSSVVLFSSCLQSFPTSGSFQMSQLFTLNMSANLETSAVATGLEKVGFHSNPKEGQCQRMLKLLHNCTHLTH